MAGGRRYEPREDEAILRAVERGARLEGDFAELAVLFGRPVATLRRRAITLGVLTEKVRVKSGPPPVRAWTPEEDARAREMRERGWSLRDIGGVLGRSPRNVLHRLNALETAAEPEAEAGGQAAAISPSADPQARACERHAAACLRAGGFWSLTERPLGNGRWAVCLPLVPPAQLAGAPR